MISVRRDLPTGTVTFLFTDIEGSTELLHDLGTKGYADALADHRRIIRDACSRHDGVEVDTQGDSFFVAFPTSQGAVEAADEMTSGLEATAVRVRIGIHTGTPHLDDEGGYVGADVNKGARIAAAGHGGQVLLSKETSSALELDTTDLGEHRLKDFTEPVWIFQLGSKTFPPLKTISNTNLPYPASSFVGREQEVAEVKALVTGEARLVTLSGPGGTGKTRLSIETASELIPEFLNGVFWVGLANLTDPGLMMDEIAQTIGAKEGVAEHISERHMLLVLDNLEQVIEATPQLSPLLEACPNLKLLVTSRELLRIKGEVEFAVPPLAEREAVELFRSRSGYQADNTVAELCRRLDNLPLAVELAAARTTVLTPEQILERFARSLDLLKGGRDSDPRQVTLRATIEWSYNLLNSKEQDLFARLAVFRGGSTLEAAEKVAGADIDTLQSLVDKSLVRYTDGRFWMLETIRGYAVERLSGLPNAQETYDCHFQWCRAFVQEGSRELRGERAVEWTKLMAQEHDNIRQALDRFSGFADVEPALELAADMWRFWKAQGFAREGLVRTENLVSSSSRPTRWLGKALAGAANLSLAIGEYSNGATHAQRSIEILSACGDPGDVGYAYTVKGGIDWVTGAFAEAEASHQAALNAFQKSQDQFGLASALSNLGVLAHSQNDLVRAHDYYEEAYEESVGEGRSVARAAVLLNLGEVCLDLGRFPEAARWLEESYQLAAELGDAAVAGMARNFLANAAVGEGDLDVAARHLTEALAVMREINDPYAQLRCLEDAALVACRLGKADRCAQLVGAIEMSRETQNVPIEPLLQERHDEVRSCLREVLAPDRLQDELDAGRDLSVDHAMELAIELCQEPFEDALGPGR